MFRWKAHDIHLRWATRSNIKLERSQSVQGPYFTGKDQGRIQGRVRVSRHPLLPPWSDSLNLLQNNILSLTKSLTVIQLCNVPCILPIIKPQCIFGGQGTLSPLLAKQFCLTGVKQVTLSLCSLDPSCKHLLDRPLIFIIKRLLNL